MESTNSVWNLLSEIGKKQGITEVIINRCDLIFVEHQGELVKLNAKIEPADLDAFVDDIAELNKKKNSDQSFRFSMARCRTEAGST